MANLLYNYTDVAQAEQLLKLGLDPTTADMYYKQVRSEQTGMPYYMVCTGHSPAIQQNLYSFRNGYIIPCWSVAALFAVLPAQIEFFKNEDDYLPNLSRCYDNPRKFICSYENGATEHWYIEDSQIDAVFNMVVWTIENGYLKPKEK